MSIRTATPLIFLGGIVALSTSALAGVGLGRYTVSGVNPIYTDGYRSLAGARSGSPDAFWSAQGQPARPGFAAFEALDPPSPSRDTSL